MSKKIVALLGPAGSGKDAILKAVCELRPDWKKLIPVTSRPVREGESQGNPYFFLTDETFRNMVVTDHLLEYQCFNGWWYGTEKNQIDENTINIGCFSPAAAKVLNLNPEIELHTIYIKTNDKQRLMRQLSREDEPNCKEICRRFQTDSVDFSDLKELYPIIVNNNDGQFMSAVTEICNCKFN